MDYEKVLASLKNGVSGETYGQYCDRLEDAIISIVTSNDSSKGALEILAFAHMEAPADFEASSDGRPRLQTKKFFSRQSGETKELFRSLCWLLPRCCEDRINVLLGE